MAVCRLMFFDFMFNAGRTSELGEECYDDFDIRDCINYVKSLLEMGFITEPHDDFNLHEFILWAEQKL